MHDLNPIIVPIGGLTANGLLAAGSYWIAAGLLRQPRRLPRWLATAVVFWTAATIGMELLGSIGAIGTAGLLGVAGLTAGLGIATWRRRGNAAPEPKAVGDGPTEREAAVGLAMVLAAALLFAIPSVFSAVKVVSDGPIYHLYFAVRWWKAGWLMLVAAPFGENAATYFPANGDIWFTWLMATWGGDTFAKVGQAPFLLMAGAAAFGCARLLGCRRSAALIATCWFVTSTPFLIYSFEPNVDTIFVAGYLTAAYFFLRYATSDAGTSALVLGALAAGLALATKPTGLVFVPPLLALVVGGLLIQRGTWPEKLSRVAIVGLSSFVTAGYWFVRSARLTGNPLYPLDVRLMGRALLTGWYGPHAMRTSPYYLPIGETGALADIVIALVDPRLAPVWLISVAGAWAVANPRTRPFRGWITLLALGAILNVALYWIVIPYRTQQRFMLQALGLAVVPLAATLDRARWLRLGAVFLLGLHILTPQAWPFAGRGGAIPWDLNPMVPNAIGSLIVVFPRIEPGSLPIPATLPSWHPMAVGLVFAAVATVAAWRWTLSTMTHPKGWWLRQLATAAATLAFVGFGCTAAGRRAFDPMFRFYPPFRDFHAGWRTFDEFCGPRGARVAYAGTNIPYYLLGRGLRNDVRYVNIDAHRDWLLHDYHREALARREGIWPNSRPGWDRIRPDFQAWLDNLDAEGIQLLVVTRVNPAEGPHNVADREGFPIERRWADAHPERFVRLYGQDEHDPWFRLYRLVRRRGKDFSGSRTDRPAGRHS